MEHYIMVFLPMITLTVVLPLAFCYYIVQKAKVKWKYDTATLTQLEDRIQAIESRLSDIQEIVISIDDQLKHASKNNTTPSLRELS